MPARFTAIVAVSVAACSPHLDSARPQAEDRSFGETVCTLTCKRLAYQIDLEDGDGKTDVRGDGYRTFCRTGEEAPPDPYPAVLALDAEREPLIAAIDLSFPDEDLADLQAYVTSSDFLTVYDDGTAERALERLAATFDLMGEDAELAPAPARLGRRNGYRPASAALGVLRAVSEYPDLGHLLLVLVDAVAEGGPARTQLDDLLRALSRELGDAQPSADPSDPERSLALAIDLLLGESELLGGGTPIVLVERDARGLAVVATDPDTGELYAPFVDGDGDGLADATDDGVFVDAQGAPLDAIAPPPFSTPYAEDTAAARDADGRALIAYGGPPVYQYVDLDRTLLAALAREGRALFDPGRGTAVDLVRGASALMGPRQPAVRTYGDGSSLAYQGWDTTQSPLLDLLYGLLLLVTDPGIDDTLAVARQLLVDHEPVAARLLEAVFAVADLADAYPRAALEPGSPFADDLVDAVNQILAVPGLAEDLLAALEDPAARGLGDRFHDQMRYRDAIDYDPVTQEVVGSFVTPVDRTQPDTGWNRSVLQRLLHLVADSAGVSLCNKTIYSTSGTVSFEECELFQIDDLAVFFAESIAYAKDGAGNLLLDEDGNPIPMAELPLTLSETLLSDEALESSSTIVGFRRHPTPQALGRVLFLDPAPAFIAETIDPVVCRDGDRFIDAHAGTLAAWELDGFYDQVRPIVQAFADHDATPLFIQLLVVMHTHYPSPESTAEHQSADPGGHGYARMSNVRAFEPLIIDALESTDLWLALVDGAPALNALVAPSGRSGPAALASAARFLFTPRDGLANRLGGTTSTTADGRPIGVLSPWHVLADALALKRARIAASGEDGAAWERSTSELIDLLARGEEVDGAWRFHDPRVRGVAVALLDFLRARALAHRQAGDLDAWATGELPGRAEEPLSGPVVAAAADLLGALSAAPAALDAIEGLNVFLTGEDGGDAIFQTLITAVADLLQLVRDDRTIVPIARVAGRAIDPEHGLVDAHLRFVRTARHADQRGILERLLRRLMGEASPGVTALGRILDAICHSHH